MVYQGLVIEVEKSHIIVLTDDANYLKLKKKGHIDVGKKIMFIEDDIIKESNKSLKPLIAIAATIILLIATIIGQFGLDFMKGFQAYAIVSLDINPSLEFQIDKNQIVRKIDSLNKDGKDILDDNMIGMKIEDAIIVSIKNAIEKQYLNDENNAVLVSDVILDKNTNDITMVEKKIVEKVEEDDDLQNIDLIYIASDNEDLEKARQNQVSIGKYKAYKIVSNSDSNIIIDDIKNKKVSEIVKENKNLYKYRKTKTNKEGKNDKGSIMKDKNNNEYDKSNNNNYEKTNNERKKDEEQIKEKETESSKYEKVKSEKKMNNSQGNINNKQNNSNSSNKNIKEDNDNGYNYEENIKKNSNRNEEANLLKKNNLDNKNDKGKKTNKNKGR